MLNYKIVQGCFVFGVCCVGIDGCSFMFEMYVVIVYACGMVTGRNDHTTMTAPLPVCSAKLSIVGPG
jgi:hypothetical protein